MRAHMTRPCENCPYRKDAPRQLWDRAEFKSVLAAEEGFGKIFNCHKQRDLPPKERGFCAGWLLDQKARGLPSLALRMELVKGAGDPAASAAIDAVESGGLKMFPTIAAMCKANGVRDTRRYCCGKPASPLARINATGIKVTHYCDTCHRYIKANGHHVERNQLQPRKK